MKFQVIIELEVDEESTFWGADTFESTAGIKEWFEDFLYDNYEFKTESIEVEEV